MNNTIENIKTHDIPSVNDLMLIARNSANFYDSAAKMAVNPALKNLFGDIARTRTLFVEGAEKQLHGKDAMPTATPDKTVTEWNTFYSEMQPRVESKSLDYVDNVQASEDRLLKAFDNVVVDNKVPAGLKQAITGYLPILQKQHLLFAKREWAKVA